MSEKVRETQAFFAGKAEAYRTSASHGLREDLDRMLRLLDLPPGARALDVATGGGHTAMALAKRARDVVATDVTRAMLDAVARSAAERGARNVRRALADAHALPFRDASFDAVTSRIAPHHFTDLRRFVREAARVLAPGGALYVFDLSSPEDEAAARVVNRIETLRDASHVWSHPASAWRDAVDASGLALERVESSFSEFDAEPWIARAAMDEGAEAELRRLLAHHGRESLGGYGLGPDGRMRVLRVELVARKPV